MGRGGVDGTLVGEQTQFPPTRNRLRAAGNTELAVDVVKMFFDGPDGDNEFLGKLAVGKAIGDQMEDFAFATREWLDYIYDLGFTIYDGW